MQAMVYRYDQLHRIVQARSLSEYGSNGYAERAPGANKYDVDYSYDENGNLLTLQRLDDQTDIQDDLTYEYNDGTNRLRNTDPAAGENYTYDKIGNLISDAAEGIDSIIWTPYGKVRAVVKDDNSKVRFRYDASGNRIAKIAGADTTVYVRDASGNVMAVYRNDTLAEQSIYGSSRLGLMTSASKAGYRTLGGKKYELSNHLGNVLAVVSDNIHLDQDSTWANVVNVTDYYPFGLAMEGRTVQDSTYRYGFNGKEEDSDGEWGSKSHYDYGFRIYNPSISKFLSVDPLTRKYPMLTPYQFASNTPIQAIDLDGLEGLIVIRIEELPTNFNKIEYAQDLQDRLIEAGAHKNTKVVYENSKEYKDLGSWSRFWDFKSDQSANITIRKMNIVRDSGHEDAGGYGENNKVVVYTGITGINQLKDNPDHYKRELPTWLYVNVTLHEIGHAVYDFIKDKPHPLTGEKDFGHDRNGLTKEGGLMDRRDVIKKDADFSEREKKIIKTMANEDE